MSKEQNSAKIKHAVEVKSNVQPAVGMTLMWLNVITVEAAKCDCFGTEGN
jgi:hypothetical protein